MSVDDAVRWGGGRRRRMISSCGQVNRVLVGSPDALLYSKAPKVHILSFAVRSSSFALDAFIHKNVELNDDNDDNGDDDGVW